MAEPIIYTKNYVSADDTFTSSHGSTFIDRMYDRDKRSFWVSSGANDDATEMTMEIVFYEGDNAVDRAIDRCIILNHNLKDPTIEYWDGDSWETFATGSTLTTANNIFTSTERTCSKVRIRCSTTQVADAEKYMGEVIFCKVQQDIGIELSSYTPVWRQISREVMSADGTLNRSVIKHSQYRSEKYEAKAQIRFMTTTLLETMRRIKDSGVAFLWQPESTSQIDEIYLVHWIGGFRWRYASDYKGAGVILEMDLKEA